MGKIQKCAMSRIRASQVVFSNSWLVVASNDVEGYTEPYYTIRTDDYVTVYAVTPDDQLLLVEQFRPALRTRSLELPSGHVEAGEMPAEAAARELLEETGYAAESMCLLGALAPDSGRNETTLWAFAATGLTRQSRREQQTLEEEIKLRLEPLAAVPQLVKDGHLKHALDLAVLFLAHATLQRGGDR
jgi:8-oxo-dGTP pyrophosphatase MutT (NUDIX family)